MTTTNVSTTKMYCACSGRWCEFANLQGFCTLTACCKGVIYDDHTTIIKQKECEFCLNHEQGDTLYESSDWDGGIGFDYIRDIKYCPICGKKLNSDDEPQTTSTPYKVDTSSICKI